MAHVSLSIVQIQFAVRRQFWWLWPVRQKKNEIKSLCYQQLLSCVLYASLTFPKLPIMWPGSPEIDKDPSELVVKTCCCPPCWPFTVIVCWSEPGSIVTVIVLLPPSWMICCSADVFAAFGSANGWLKWSLLVCILISCSFVCTNPSHLPCPSSTFSGCVSWNV